jgi:hypothetical protein
VGVFLAVFGQVYQTGADRWDLFAQWSALIFGWVLLARFTPLWGVWLVVTNLALGLYLVQTGFFDHNLFVMHTFLNGVILVARSVCLPVLPIQDQGHLVRFRRLSFLDSHYGGADHPDIDGGSMGIVFYSHGFFHHLAFHRILLSCHEYTQGIRGRS